ncbi:MAG: hypothetical protein ACI4ES_09355 [Roseburia sp.]
MILIPYAILSGKIKVQQVEAEIRILDLSEEGFTFRLPAKQFSNLTMTAVSDLEMPFSVSAETDMTIYLQFYCFAESRYQKVELRDFSCEEEERTEFYTVCRVTTENTFFQKCARMVMEEYTRYIQLKLEESDAVLSEELTGYPAEKDTIFSADFAQQKKLWLFQGKTEPLSVLNTAMEKCVQTGSFELALSLEQPEHYVNYLEQDVEQFVKKFWMEQGLEEHPFAKKKATILYLGNQFCPFLFPEKELLELLEKAEKDKITAVIVFSYMAESKISSTKECLQKLAFWCEKKKTTLELVINDWGMASMIREMGYTCFRLTLGILLQKRRKDVRLPYKNGFEEHKEELEQSAIDAPFYQRYLKEQYGFERISYEACGYPYEVSAEKACLHLPFYQMNTAEHCTLYAACKNGARGRQSVVKHCPHYCREQAFLYPDHLHMVGRYNSLFGYDENIFWDADYFQGFLEQGVDRIVVGML